MSSIDLQTMSLILLDFRGDPSDHRVMVKAARPTVMGASHSGKGEVAVAGDLPGRAAYQPGASSRLEKLVEHIFISDLLRYLWLRGHSDVEVLRAEVDAAGYDLVLEAGGILRHVQLKSSRDTAKTNKVDINLSLAAKPSGCVIWFRYDPATLILGPFRWLGGAPGQKLPALGDRAAKHSKGNKDGVKAIRPNLRAIPQSQFTVLTSLDALAEALFGFKFDADGDQPVATQMEVE